MVAKIFYSYFLLTLFVTYSLAANLRRATDYGSGNNAEPVVDKAGEEPIAKANVKTQDDMSLGEIATNALSGAVQSGIANTLLGNNGGNNGGSNGNYGNNGGNNGQDFQGEQPIASEDGVAQPHSESKMRQIAKGAIQGAIAGAAAAAVGTAVNRNN